MMCLPCLVEVVFDPLARLVGCVCYGVYGITFECSLTGVWWDVVYCHWWFWGVEVLRMSSAKDLVKFSGFVFKRF